MANDINSNNFSYNSGECFNQLPTSSIQIPSKSQISGQKSHDTLKIYNLRDRLRLFSRTILGICRRLPKIPECDALRRQLANACTSIGANFEEADGALTKRDFINKAGIARKEAKETKYWLQVICDTYIHKNELEPHIKESEEIISILSSILKNSGYKFRH